MNMLKTREWFPLVGIENLSSIQLGEALSVLWLPLKEMESWFQLQILD